MTEVQEAVARQDVRSSIVAAAARLLREEGAAAGSGQRQRGEQRLGGRGKEAPLQHRAPEEKGGAGGVLAPPLEAAVRRGGVAHQSSTSANTSGATMEASDSMTNLGVSTPSFPQVIFSFGTAPEYDP